jgi:hypothetical protein
MQVGSRVELHRWSCLSPEQHERAAVGGAVACRLGDGWLVRLDEHVVEFGGVLVEGPSFWPEGSCPNARPAAGEQAA